MNALNLKYINLHSKLFYLWWLSYSDDYYNCTLINIYNCYCILLARLNYAKECVDADYKTTNLYNCEFGNLSM